MALKPITLKDTAQSMYGSGSAEFGIKENIQAAAGKVKSGATMLKRKAGMALREAASKGSEMAKGAAGAARSKGSAMAREAAGVARTEGGKFVSKAKGKASNSAKKAADMVAKKRAAAGFRASSNPAEFRKIGSKNKQRKLRNTLLGTTTAGRLTRGIGAAALLGGAARLALRKKGAIVAGSSSPYGRAALPASKYRASSNAAEFAIPNPFKKPKKSGVVGAIVGKTTAGKVARVGALAGAVGLGLAAKRYGGQASAAASLAGQKSRTTLQPKAMDTVSSVKAAGASVGRQIKSDIGGVTNAAKNAAANVKSSIGGFIPKKKPKQLRLPGG